MAKGTATSILLTWNTIGWGKGNYTISANATVLPRENETTDNTLVDSWVFVTIPGDVDGDLDVDIYDIVKICDTYGSQKGDLVYIPNCDINCNGKIDIYDVVIACANYGKIDT